jgi:UDP-N-acetyl-D-glucosamine/UDP-N-acetyl-D-galactosamine dehydrogenase
MTRDSETDAMPPAALDHRCPLAVIGLGYVGLPLALAFSAVRPVLGYDIDRDRVAALSAGHDATREVDDQELVAAVASGRLRLSAEPAELAGSRVYVVTVPTPIDAQKRPDLGPLERASACVGAVLSDGDLVVFESTVYPGCTEEVCVPILEQASGLRYREGFHVGYSPERINPGDREHRVANICKVTSGSTPEVAAQVDAMYAAIITAGTHRAQSIRVAEAAKVIENTQRDLNIALMNELALLFARLDIDTSAVLAAAGSKWNFLPFRPGLVGGHCIGVDPYYLTHKAEQVGYHPQVILAGRRINDGMGRHVARSTVKLMIRNGIDVANATVGVLGLTFKENCPDIRNSRVIDIIREFQDYGIRVLAEDPQADPLELDRAFPGVELVAIEEPATLDALVVAVAHAQYASRSAAGLRRLLRGPRPVIADVKSLYDRQALESLGVTVWRL